MEFRQEHKTGLDSDKQATQSDVIQTGAASCDLN